MTAKEQWRLGAVGGGISEGKESQEVWGIWKGYSIALPLGDPHPTPEDPSLPTCLASVHTASCPGHCLSLPCHLTVSDVQNCSPGRKSPCSATYKEDQDGQRSSSLPGCWLGWAAIGTGVDGKESQQCPLVVEGSNDSHTSYPCLGQPGPMQVWVLVLQERQKSRFLWNIVGNPRRRCQAERRRVSQ